MSILYAAIVAASLYPLYCIQHWARCPACWRQAACNARMIRQAWRGYDTTGRAEIGRPGIGACITRARHQEWKP